MSWNFDNTLICNNSEHFHGWVTLYLSKNRASSTPSVHMRWSSSSYATHMRCSSSAYALQLQLICAGAPSRPGGLSFQAI